jgi:DNA-binding NarL/FixJ family response regulator
VTGSVGADRLRVVLVDDHPDYREGIVAALGDEIDVVGEAGDAAEAVRVTGEQQPDVVLMDLHLGDGGSGITATREITSRHPDTRIVVLTMSEDDDTIVAALRAGARAYLLKESPADDILRAMQSVSRGEAVLGAKVSGRVLQALAAGDVTARRTAAFPDLTPREHEVLEMVAQGLDNMRIATRLDVAEKTVRNNVSAILTKLQVATRAEAVAKARDAGIGA